MRFEQWLLYKSVKIKTAPATGMQSFALKVSPTVCNHFEQKQEAEDWAQGVERQIKIGQFKFERVNTHRTLLTLLSVIFLMAHWSISEHKKMQFVLWTIGKNDYQAMLLSILSPSFFLRRGSL
jgi:hypothetical protein